MKNAINLTVFLLASFASTSASAEMRELSQNELRESVQLGQTMKFKDLLAAITERVPGEPIDVRGFASDTVYYRVLIKQPNGKLCAVIIDAKSGAFMSGETSAARQVMATAKGNKGKAGTGHRVGSNFDNGGGHAKGRGGGNGGGKS